MTGMCVPVHMNVLICIYIHDICKTITTQYMDYMSHHKYNV